MIRFDIEQTAVQFHQIFIYQKEQKQNVWTMSIQYVSILQIFQTFSQKIQKQFILYCPKNFSQFLSVCLVYLQGGERKRDVVKYKKNIVKNSHEEELHCIKGELF